MVELAAPKGSDPSDIVEKIVNDSANNSIYKGNLVELQFHQQNQDEFEGVIHGQIMDIRFLPAPSISDDDIVLSDETVAVLERNVVEFHNQRRRLKELGLPGKRGLLFYGPPGTGKTYTSKYLASKLQEVTTIVVSGGALGQVKAVCNVARMLQPTLVIMEDVDLVFGRRETNFATAPLGDLMDELDGFARDDEILYILTTNAIDRVEAAIRDRPGRVSQCIHFGPPSLVLRERYLSSLLGQYTRRSASVSELAEMTEGCTQAFIKELCYRAVQIAFGRLDAKARGEVRSDTIELAIHDFADAMDEMRSGAGRAGEAIIGFRVRDN